MIRVFHVVLLFVQQTAVGVLLSAAVLPSAAADVPMSTGCFMGVPRSEIAVSPTSPDTPIPEQYDLIFIDAMLDRGTVTLGLANQALQQTKSAAVWRIALRIAESQAGALQLLRGWRQTWYPAAPPWRPRTDSATPLVSVQTCPPAEVDQQFLRTMTSHLQSVVEFATVAQPAIEHPELQDFAYSITESEDREIRSMQTLLNSIATPLPD